MHTNQRGAALMKTPLPKGHSRRLQSSLLGPRGLLLRIALSAWVVEPAGETGAVPVGQLYHH